MARNRRTKKTPRSSSPPAPPWVPSEEESFSGDSATEWEIKDIVDEYVLFHDVSTHEVAWKGWKRRDGTNTTWNVDFQNQDTIEDWNKKVGNPRQKLAEKHPLEVFLPGGSDSEQELVEKWFKSSAADPDVLPPLASCEFPDRIKTKELMHGTQKKLANFEDRQVRDDGGQYSGWASARRVAPTRAPVLRKRPKLPVIRTKASQIPSSSKQSNQPKARKAIPARVTSSPSIPSGSNSYARRSLSPATSDSSESGQLPDIQDVDQNQRASNSYPARRPFPASSTSLELGCSYSDPEHSSEECAAPSARASISTKPVLKKQLSSNRISGDAGSRSEWESNWKKLAYMKGAADISIAQDDSELFAPGFNFIWMEQEYIYAENIPEIAKPHRAKDFMPCCECTGRCTASGGCACILLAFQDNMMDLDDGQGFIYDNYKEGLMTNIPASGMYATECNEGCHCVNGSEYSGKGKGKARDNGANDCGNRVAQQPRRYPIEIFKTRDRGWGARSSTDIPKGAVLGCYTGEIINRELEIEESRYCYALDLVANDHDEYDDDRPRYTISAYKCGNWTRFINHSCDPEARSVPIIYDTTHEHYIPKLACVALRDIPAGKEITIDYSPKDAKLKGKKGRDSEKCRCGSKRCRRWISVSMS